MEKSDRNRYGIVLDLNSLFDWNVKQLFLYLVAEYVTPTNVNNEIHFSN